MQLAGHSAGLTLSLTDGTAWSRATGLSWSESLRSRGYSQLCQMLMVLFYIIGFFFVLRKMILFGVSGAKYLRI